LLSANPEPPLAEPFAAPVEHLLHVVP
jgi:hypothetical protein